jgi:Protein of unknown function (DUF2946)
MWFRGNIRQGAWLALIALAINIALSFGHVHAIYRNGQKHHSGGLVLALLSHDADHGGSDNDSLPDDLCPICLAIATIATGLAPTPPVLPVQFTVATIDHTSEDAAIVVEPQRAAFQSRGPPIS